MRTDVRDCGGGFGTMPTIMMNCTVLQGGLRERDGARGGGGGRGVR